jgi:hypothetical protein
MFWGWDTDAADSQSWPMVRFGIDDFEPLDSTTTVLVYSLSVNFKSHWKYSSFYNRDQQYRKQFKSFVQWFWCWTKIDERRLYSIKRYVTIEVILYHKIMAQLGSAVYHNTKNLLVLQPTELKECKFHTDKLWSKNLNGLLDKWLVFILMNCVFSIIAETGQFFKLNYKFWNAYSKHV